ncbi:MAG: bifunctional oligoribonuclease/PAP phosphatase NrnA [Anaeroplasmataceae bacterium]|nr:bifunctional oligoribonuclease/PAP phosphatase NrnA [Anaeroplasmataceae bacterium]
MIEKLFQMIESHDTIILHRHSRPDLDALGSQRGLALVLKTAYPKKKIFMVGDMSSRYAFLGQMDEIEDAAYAGALAIITDVAVSNMVSDDRYRLAKDVFVIDHHKNACDITENVIADPTKIAVCELITEILLARNLMIPKDAATALFGGIVTDSGRFQYGETTGDTLFTAGKLLNLGADKEFIYRNLYTESLKDRQIKNWFGTQFQTTAEGVGYLKNKEDVFERFNIDFFTVSRGMVSVMAGITEIPIWCNFTLDIANHAIVGEFRSRELSIVSIAKKYGGGGHDLACGATLASWDEVDLVIEDFNELLRKSKKESI